MRALTTLKDLMPDAKISDIDHWQLDDYACFKVFFDSDESGFIVKWLKYLINEDMFTEE